MTSRTGQRWRRDDGSATVELVLLAPILMLVTMLVIGLGRVETANLTVTGTAGAAARAASLARTPAEAVAQAKTMAAKKVGWSCPRPEVSVDTHDFRPGGLVRVTVVCRPRMADISAVGLPGHLRVAATMASGIDAWREVGSQ